MSVIHACNIHMYIHICMYTRIVGSLNLWVYTRHICSLNCEIKNIFDQDMPNCHPMRHAILFSLRSRRVPIPSHSTCNFPLVQIRTCPIPIQPDMQFHYGWNPDVSQFQHIRHAISLVLKSIRVPIPSHLTCNSAFLKSEQAQIPSNPTCNLNFFEIRTCPIPTQPDTPFNFCWKPDVPNFLPTQHAISFFCKFILSQSPPNPTRNFTFVEIRTFPNSITSEVQFHFCWNLDMPILCLIRTCNFACLVVGHASFSTSAWLDFREFDFWGKIKKKKSFLNSRGLRVARGPRVVQQWTLDLKE